MKTVTFRVKDDLVAVAKRYKINISEACRNGIQSAIEREKKIRELLNEE